MKNNQEMSTWKFIGTILSGMAILIGGVFTFITWIGNSEDAKIQPVQAQTNQNTTDIANINTNLSGVNVKLDFLLGKYGAQYSARQQKVIIATSTQ